MHENVFIVFWKIYPYRVKWGNKLFMDVNFGSYKLENSSLSSVLKLLKTYLSIIFLRTDVFYFTIIKEYVVKCGIT